MSEPIIKARDVRKSFGAKKALDGAGLTLNRGEVLGLVGDNGAGKSTLLKVLSGDIRRDSGEILLKGQKAELGRPDRARARGVEMVYQDLSLCGSMTVYENVFLGRYLTRPLLGFLLPVLHKRAMADRTGEILSRLGLDTVSPFQPVNNLSGGEQQAVALGRCLLFSPEVILLDEPTASLAVKEQQKILGIIRELRDRGRSQIVVSHNLEEIFQVADRVAVLKEGRTVWTGPLDGMTTEDLARLMFLGKA